LVNFPGVNCWSPGVTRRYPEETKVEQKLLEELLAAVRECGF
jgi:signal recognition particle subunit SEC65